MLSLSGNLNLAVIIIIDIVSQEFWRNFAVASSQISWAKAKNYNLSTLEPNGYSPRFEVNIYLGRYPQNEGFQIGSFHPFHKGIHSADPEGGINLFDDIDKIQLMVYPPNSLSWVFVRNKEEVEALRPLLISGGKHVTGEEDAFYCRSAARRTLMIGYYLFSDPMKCLVAFSAKESYGNDTFEMLFLNAIGQAMGIKLK